MKPPSHLFVLLWELHHPGGVNEVVRNLHAQFAAKGPLRPVVFSTDWNNPRPETQVSSGDVTIRFQLRQPYEPARPVKSFVAFLLTLPLVLWRLGRVLRRECVRVVNPHYPSLQAWNFVLARRFGFWRGKIVVSAHGDEILNAGRTHGCERFLWRGMLRAADVIIVPSHHLEEEVVKIARGLKNRIRVVYNGVDVVRLEAIAQTEAAVVPAELRGRRFVVNVGSFEHRKAHDVTLRAFCRVAESWQDVHLVLVGGAGPLSARVEEMIRESGLGDRVHRYESAPYPIVVALLRQAELLVLPSRHESFGIVLVEAGVFRVPAIATRVGGVPEVIEDGVNGRLVDVEDADALAEQMLELLGAREERTRLGSAMRRLVEEQFNWDHARDLYASIIQAA